MDIKLIDGEFFYGESVTLEINGKQIKRKVNYGSLDGLYVIIKGEKYGKTDIKM